MTTTFLVQPGLLRSGEPGKSTYRLFNLHGTQQNVSIMEKQEVVSFGAPADAAEAGRRVIARFPKTLGRLSEL